MCCIFASLLLIGPRFVGAIWWIVRPSLWSITFNGSWLLPLLGLIFLPWTTLMYVLVSPGGITGFEWVWIALAVFADIASYGGSAYGNRDRIPGYASTTPKVQ
jgi:hypothetical protein